MGDPVVQLRKGSGLETLNLPVVPIVFLPGVMGTRLAMPGGTDWDPDSATAMLSIASADMRTKQRDLNVFQRPVAKAIRSLSTASAAILNGNASLTRIAQNIRPGLTPAVLYTERGWGGPVASFYLDILVRLEVEFNRAFINLPLHPVYAFGYDWRQTNANGGQELRVFVNKVIAENPGAKEVVLVTHSMGGLVARAAIAVTGETGIAAVIHGAQPSNGTPVAYRRFHTGARPPFEGNTVPDQVLNAIMGATPEDYTTVQSGLPGPVQLLPNQLYHRTSGAQWLVTPNNESLDNVYDIYLRTDEPGIMKRLNVFPGLDGVLILANLAAVIEQARAFHTALGNSCHSQTHVVFSDGMSTDVVYDSTKSGFGAKVVKQAAGDATVTAVSGSCPDFPANRVRSRRAVPGLEHSKVYADLTFNNHVIALLQAILGGLVGPIPKVTK